MDVIKALKADSLIFKYFPHGTSFVGIKDARMKVWILHGFRKSLMLGTMWQRWGFFKKAMRSHCEAVKVKLGLWHKPQDPGIQSGDVCPGRAAEWSHPENELLQAVVLLGQSRLRN